MYNQINSKRIVFRKDDYGLKEIGVNWCKYSCIECDGFILTSKKDHIFISHNEGKDGKSIFLTYFVNHSTLQFVYPYLFNNKKFET